MIMIPTIKTSFMYNKAMEESKRYYVLFKGRVQGVGFRWTLIQVATKNGLTGKVKNLYSGDVESYMQGPKEMVLKTIREMMDISSWIRIDDYFMKEVDLIKDEKSFTVDY